MGEFYEIRIPRTLDVGIISKIILQINLNREMGRAYLTLHIGRLAALVPLEHAIELEFG
jgi:hypothetical protein